MGRQRTAPEGPNVFLHVPFDSAYERLFTALVSGLIALGCIPRCAVEIVESGEGRLNRIYRLLGESQYSIHDLSRVQGSTRRREARFNMPFELGLAYSLRKEKRTHQFLIFEEVRYRLTRTLSDLNGFDPQIHDGEPMKMPATSAGELRLTPSSQH